MEGGCQASFLGNYLYLPGYFCGIVPIDEVLEGVKNGEEGNFSINITPEDFRRRKRRIPGPHVSTKKNITN